MKIRILEVPAERRAAFVAPLARAIDEIYAPDAERRRRIEAELEANAADRASLLLAAERADDGGTAGGGALAGLLLVSPLRDPFTEAADASLRVLYTLPAHRQRGVAASLLERAAELLKARGLSGIRVDAMYGDDAIVGLFERRGYMRGRMELTHTF